MFEVGQIVRVKAPFTELFPETYVIEGISVTGAFQIAGGIDFDAIFLELVL